MKSNLVTPQVRLFSNIFESLEKNGLERNLTMEEIGNGYYCIFNEESDQNLSFYIEYSYYELFLSLGIRAKSGTTDEIILNLTKTVRRTLKEIHGVFVFIKIKKSVSLLENNTERKIVWGNKTM